MAGLDVLVYAVDHESKVMPFHSHDKGGHNENMHKIFVQHYFSNCVHRLRESSAFQQDHDRFAVAGFQ